MFSQYAAIRSVPVQLSASAFIYVGQIELGSLRSCEGQVQFDGLTPSRKLTISVDPNLRGAENPEGLHIAGEHTSVEDVQVVVTQEVAFRLMFGADAPEEPCADGHQSVHSDTKVCDLSAAQCFPSRYSGRLSNQVWTAGGRVGLCFWNPSVVVQKSSSKSSFNSRMSASAEEI
jgi:hypothetical protein